MGGESLDNDDVFADQYRVVDVLSETPSSTVYRAEDINLGRDVALKILDLGPSRDTLDDVSQLETWVRRFEREAQLVSQLKDPNTVTIYDFGTHDAETWYIAFEYIDGQTLDALVAEEGPLEPERAVRYTRQVLRSLHEAHAREVLHRDIKPSNIMVFDRVGRPDGVKVLDFGIAKPTSVEGNVERGADVTREEIILGTPRYMAPEQAKSEELYPATDLYAVGLVLWELLVGRPPIDKDDTISILSRQVSSEPFTLPDSADVPPRLRAIVETAVAKGPGDRFQSAEEMLEALEAVDFEDSQGTLQQFGRPERDSQEPYEPFGETAEDIIPEEAGGASLREESSSEPVVESDHWFGDGPPPDDGDDETGEIATSEVDYEDGGTADIPADERTEAGPAAGVSDVGPDALSRGDTLDVKEVGRPSAEIEPTDTPSSDGSAPDETTDGRERDDDTTSNSVSQSLDDPEVWPLVRQIGMYAAGILGLLYIGSVVLGPHPLRTVFGPETARTVDSYVLGYIPGLGGDLDTKGVDTSTESIFEAIAVTQWEPDIETGSVATGDEARKIRTYEWGDATMTVEIYEHDSPAGAHRRLQKIEAPERAIRIASKAVVMRVADEENTIRLEPAYKTLQNYRSLLARD